MAEFPAVDEPQLGDDASFALTARFAASRVEVGVLGEVDLRTAPALYGVLDGLIERGLSEVVLDLSGLDFIDASGLGVIAAVSARLRTNGGVLTLRSSSTWTRRLLDATGMLDLIESEPDPSDSDAPLQPNAAAHRLSALSSRETIAQAQGVLMAREGIAPDAAYAELCRSSRHAGVTVRDCAAAIVAGAVRGHLIGAVEA